MKNVCITQPDTRHRLRHHLPIYKMKNENIYNWKLIPKLITKAEKHFFRKETARHRRDSAAGSEASMEHTKVASLA